MDALWNGRKAPDRDIILANAVVEAMDREGIVEEGTWIALKYAYSVRKRDIGDRIVQKLRSMIDKKRESKIKWQGSSRVFLWFKSSSANRKLVW